MLLHCLSLIALFGILVQRCEADWNRNVLADPTIRLEARVGEHIRIGCIDSPLNVDPEQRLRAPNAFSWYRANRTLLREEELPEHWYVDGESGALHINGARPEDSDYYKCVVPVTRDLIRVAATELRVATDEDIRPTVRQRRPRPPTDWQRSEVEQVRPIAPTTTTTSTTTEEPERSADDWEAEERSEDNRDEWPLHNPTDVRIEPIVLDGDDRQDDRLAMRISWTPIDPATADVRSYRYRVLWIEPGAEQPVWSQEYIDDVRVDHLDVRVTRYARHLARVRLWHRSTAPAAVRRQIAALHKAQRVPDVYGWPSEGRPQRAPEVRWFGRCTTDNDDAGEETNDDVALCVEWDPIAADEANGQLQGYRVAVWSTASGAYRWDERVGANATQVRLVDRRRENDAYSVRVAALNGRFEGPQSEPLEFEVANETSYE